MHWKLNEKNKYLAISLLGHLGFVGVYFILTQFRVSLTPSSRETIAFEVAERLEDFKPARLAKPEDIVPSKTLESKPPPENARRVFGVNRNALTVESSSDSSVEVKKGNTLAKENDSLALNDDDPDLVGVEPVEEFLVTELPKVEKDFRVPYPAEAKSKGIAGAVTFDLLIDASGQVRDVKLISGPGSPLDEAAQEGVRKIKFRPARVGNQNVAVRIRYVYRFVLEN